MAAPTFPTKSELLTLINTYLQTNGTILATEHNDIETSLVNAIYGGQVGDIKEISCDLTYITNNFIIGTSDINEGRALSTSDRYGWAICNGKNGTFDKRGRVAIGYDSVNYAIGTTGGNKDGVVISHSHYVAVAGSQTIGNSNSLYDGSNGSRNEQGLSARSYDASSDAFDFELTTAAGSINSGKTSTTGESGTNKNMQPYIVTLFIQRIAPY